MQSQTDKDTEREINTVKQNNRHTGRNTETDRDGEG